MSNQSKPTSSPSSHWEVIDESLMKYTYGSDQAMYPAPLLTYDRLRSWVESCPELCIVLRRGHDDSQPQVSATTVMESVLGTIIVIPLLRKYWNRLTGEGKPEIGTPFEDTLMQEHDVDPSEMFPSRTGGQGSEKAEVGLHVFHIERFTGLTAEEEGRRIGFTQLALEEVRGRVGTIFPSWSVMGYSGMYSPWEAEILSYLPGTTSPTSFPTPKHTVCLRD